MPINKDETTSLVQSAKTMARIGGKRDKNPTLTACIKTSLKI
jgi:hypothetical protein